MQVTDSQIRWHILIPASRNFIHCKRLINDEPGKRCTIDMAEEKYKNKTASPDLSVRRCAKRAARSWVNSISVSMVMPTVTPTKRSHTILPLSENRATQCLVMRMFSL